MGVSDGIKGRTHYPNVQGYAFLFWLSWAPYEVSCRVTVKLYGLMMGSDGSLGECKMRLPWLVSWGSQEDEEQNSCEK